MLTALTALLSVLKLGKVGVTGLSMIVSLAVYASIWGWGFAAGFVALLFAHEMGHVMAARIRGLPVSAPAFDTAQTAAACSPQATSDQSARRLSTKSQLRT